MRRNVAKTLSSKECSLHFTSISRINNRVPKIKAKKKQWNTRKLLPGLTGDEMLEVFRKDREDKIRAAEEKECKRIEHEEKRKQREAEKERRQVIMEQKKAIHEVKR